MRWQAAGNSRSCSSSTRRLQKRGGGCSATSDRRMPRVRQASLPCVSKAIQMPAQQHRGTLPPTATCASSPELVVLAQCALLGVRQPRGHRLADTNVVHLQSCGPDSNTQAWVCMRSDKPLHSVPQPSSVAAAANAPPGTWPAVTRLGVPSPPPRPPPSPAQTTRGSLALPAHASTLLLLLPAWRLRERSSHLDAIWRGHLERHVAADVPVQVAVAALLLVPARQCHAVPHAGVPPTSAAAARCLPHPQTDSCQNHELFQAVAGSLAHLLVRFTNSCVCSPVMCSRRNNATADDASPDVTLQQVHTHVNMLVTGPMNQFCTFVMLFVVAVHDMFDWRLTAADSRRLRIVCCCRCC
jgi:hypothetical protein